MADPDRRRRGPGLAGIGEHPFLQLARHPHDNDTQRQRTDPEAMGDAFKATDKRLVVGKIWEEPETGGQSGKVLELRLKG
jgi:hypothetical protein